MIHALAASTAAGRSRGSIAVAAATRSSFLPAVGSAPSSFPLSGDNNNGYLGKPRDAFFSSVAWNNNNNEHGHNNKYHVNGGFQKYPCRRYSKMALLKELRGQSGAPIVDCKKALEQCEDEGDDKEKILRSAMDWLREHGSLKVSSKLQGRDATEGLIGIAFGEGQQQKKAGVLVKVSSETDFASRSENFGNLVHRVSNAILSSSLSLSSSSPSVVLSDSEITSASTSDDSATVDDLLKEAIVSIRENISIPKAIRLQVPPDDENGVLVGYVHGRVLPSKDAGTSAAVVYLSREEGATTTIDDDAVLDAGKKLAMHIVAAKPQYTNKDDVPPEALSKEKDLLLKELEKEESASKKPKPPEIMEKIVAGRLNKNFYQQVCLNEQQHMIVTTTPSNTKNPKVSQVLKDAGVVVKRFEAMWIS